MGMSFFNGYMNMPSDNFALSSSTNDLEISSSAVVLFPSADITLTGIVPPTERLPGLIFLINTSPTFSVLCPNDDPGSTAGFRFSLPAASFTLGPSQTQILFFIAGLGWKPAIQPTW